MKLSRGFLITLFVILGTPVALVLISPMGSGNKSNCKALKYDLLTLSESELKDKYNNSLNVIIFNDGNVLGLCEDSHSSYFGGNMVVKINDSKFLTYMGHVCGPQYLRMYRDEYESLSKRNKVDVNKFGFASFLMTKLPFSDL